MGTRSTCRKVHFLLQMLTSNKNSEWEAGLGGHWQNCRVTAADSRDPPGGNRASRSQFRWAELPYSTGMGEEREYQSMRCELLCHPFASLNYLTLKLRVERSQFTNKRLPTLLQDSLYVTKAFLLSSVELAVFLARKITKIWDYFFVLLYVSKRHKVQKLLDL